ncbi:MAG TPA: UbiA-like polyprenyltransferase [Thermodesulfobacteriota bacterium]|nr:UbiA-like polyprenyltransferase [Thermodesulfobacteriota bacterium]
MKTLLLLAELVKFEHTLFALPFAYMGAWLGAGGPPKLSTALWILLAMIGARTSAMAFNRLADARIDAKNPRTSARPIPSGRMSAGGAWTAWALFVILFFVAAYKLNTLALMLSPLALVIIHFYSYTKRFTSASHLVLGLSLAIAPIGGWIAVTGHFSLEALLLGGGVLFWVAGFDCLYACQDEGFDREHGLHSIPSRWGKTAAFWAARSFHLIAFIFFAATGWLASMGLFYFAGLILVFLFLSIEHWIISPRDLSNLQMSFFTLNAAVSLVLFLATLIDFMSKI